MTENSEALKDSSDAEVEAEVEAEDARNHLSDVEAGAGCTEIWEHLSESRDGADRD